MRKAPNGRSPGVAAEHDRPGHQPQDHKGARPYRAAGAPHRCRRGHRIGRRNLLWLIAGTAVSGPLAGRAQQKPMPVIGILAAASPENAGAQRMLAAFRQGLREAGYVEGQNIAIEYRWAEAHFDRLPALAADLVGRKVDVIVTEGGD